MSAAIRPASIEPTFVTRLFGTIQVSPSRMVHFADGLPGFPNSTHFALLPAQTRALAWLQSLDAPALAFLLIRWGALSEPLGEIGGDAYAIVTLPAQDETATANLQAPVIIDPVSRAGHQFIRTDAVGRTAVPFDLPTLLQPA
ncbi:MAG TPA: flagellar assembly protein FliW [Gemmatimonadales bacterium]|jgi:flagellar assembly factor FliW